MSLNSKLAMIMEALIPRHHFNPVIVLRRVQSIPSNPWQHRNKRGVLEVYEEPPQPVLKRKKERKTNVVKISKMFLEIKSEVWKDHFPQYSDEDITVIVTELWHKLTIEEKEAYIEFE